MKYTILAKFLSTHLRQNQWSLVDCIHYMGDIPNDINQARLHAWLNGDELPQEREIDRLACAFAVSHDDIQVMIDGDQHRMKQIRSHIREFDPNYYLHIWVMPAICQRTTLPEGMTEEEAIIYVSQTLKRIHRKGFLDTPRGVIHWFSDTGVLHASRVMKAPKAIFDFS